MGLGAVGAVGAVGVAWAAVGVCSRYGPRTWNGPSWRCRFGYGVVSWETDAWNDVPMAVLTWSARVLPRGAVPALYSFGTAVAGTAMLAMLLVLVGTCVQVLLLLVTVPGVTLPWTDMVPLLAAVALGQAWHEAGHALAAAWHHLRPMHLGVSLLCPGVPVAHVALPSLRALRLPHQLRVISAGVTHNALLLGLCALVYGVGSAAQKDARGLYVVRVDDAAMRASMPPDTTIVQLNDVDLSMLAPSARWDVWSALQQGTLASDLGWCVSRGDWAAAPASCAPPALDATCFVQVEAPHAPRALEPLAVLGPAARCRGAEDCASPGGVCVLVSGDLTPTARVYLGTSASTDLVLLRGPFDALGALVHVTPMRLRGPAWLRAARVRRVAELVEWPLRYVSVVNMTLLLGNMLPLPFLDGGAYLHVLLRWWMGADDVDAWSLDDAGHALELDLECAAAPAPSSGDIERVLRYVLYGTCALCVAAALGSAWATWRVG